MSLSLWVVPMTEVAVGDVNLAVGGADVAVVDAQTEVTLFNSHGSIAVLQTDTKFAFVDTYEVSD